MNVLLVYAYEDPASFGAAMHNRALSFFERQGHKVLVSDLYASGFHAVAAKWDFSTSGGAHRNYMMEQNRVASIDDGVGFAEDIKDEIAKIRQAELIILEFPLWWSAPPAIMKGWFDKVFAMGVAWDGEHRYKKGLLAGKRSLVMTGAGDPEEYYTKDGLHGATITQHLYPLLHSTLAHAGLDVLNPFIVSGLTASDEAERLQHLTDLEKYLEEMIAKPLFIYKHN